MLSSQALDPLQRTPQEHRKYLHGRAAVLLIILGVLLTCSSATVVFGEVSEVVGLPGQDGTTENRDLDVGSLVGYGITLLLSLIGQLVLALRWLAKHRWRWVAGINAICVLAVAMMVI